MKNETGAARTHVEDHIMVMGPDFEQNLKYLQEVLKRFRAENPKLNPEKCELFRTSWRFLVI